MKERYRKFLKIAAVLAVTLILSGCSVAGRTVYFATSGWPFYLMKIGPVTCDRKEARVYLANYRNIYGNIGGADLLNAGDEKFEKGIKNALVSHLARVCSLQLYANEKGVVLTTDESKEVAQAAEEYYKSLTPDETNYMGVSESDIREMYSRYALAQKVYDSLMNSVDDEVSEDEARIMDAYVIFTKKKNTAKKVEEELNNKVDFKTVCDRYTEKEKGKLSFGRGTYPDEVEKVCFRLENGESSGKIKTDEGYYFVKCVNKYNKKKSEKNKEKIISDKKEKLFNDIIESQREKYFSNLNMDMLDAMHIEEDEKITTDSFFTTLENHLSY